MLELGEFSYEYHKKIIPIVIQAQPRVVITVGKISEIISKNLPKNIKTFHFKKVIYVYGIAQSKDEKDEIVKEAKEILDVKDVITSILLVEDLRIKKD